MSNPIDFLMQGALAGDYARGQEDNRNLRQQQTADLEASAARTANIDTANSMAVLARQLDITDDAGMSINKTKLGALLQGQRDSGQFDSRVQQLVSMLGNEDLAAKQNPGFQFKGLTQGPDGTLALQGSYEGDKKNRYATVGRASGDDAQVAFSSVEDVVGLIEGQYNQQWTKPGVSDLYNEMTSREGVRTTGNQLQVTEPKLKLAVSKLTNELEGAIAATAGSEEGARIVTDLKQELSGLPYHAKLEVLRDYGSRLKIPVQETITPEVEEAAKIAATGEQNGQQTPDASTTPSRIAEIEKALADRSYASGMDGAKTVAAKEAELKAELASLKGEEAPAKQEPAMSRAQENRYKRLLSSAKKNLASAEKSGDKKFIERAQERVNKFEAKLGRGQEEETTDENPLIEASAKRNAGKTDEDVIEGNVEMSEEEIKALQQALKDDGVTNMAELFKTTKARQQQFRNVISVMAKDKETRRDYVQRFNNAMSTGSADLAPKDVASANVAQQNADSSTQNSATTLARHFQVVEKHDFDVGEKIGNRIRDNFTAAKKAIYGYDSKGNIGETIDFDENRFFSEFGGAFNNAYREYTRAKGKEAKAATKTALNSMMSMGIQALAESEEYGSFGENFLPDGSIDFIDGTDSLLSRLAKRPDGSVIVVDANGGKQEESVPKRVLKKIFGNAGYGYFIKEIEGQAGSLKSQQR